MTRRSGLALLVVVGVLGVLAVLGVAFVTMAQLERKASQQRLLSAKAYLLARSGLEDAQARLELGQDPAFGGENWDGSADGLLSAFEADQEAYRVTGTGTSADAWACPVRQAMRPSFFACAFPSPNPSTLRVDGRLRGHTGRLSGDRETGGNTFATRVSREEGFFINGGDPSRPASEGYNAVLRRILGVLAEALDREDGANDGKPVDQLDGEALITLRPRGGYRSLGEARTLALGGSAAKHDALSPYLCTHAWVDRKVLGHNLFMFSDDGFTSSWCPGWTDQKGYHYSYPSFRHRPDFERTTDGRISGRAPVSLAWARSRRAVLIALLAGLKGIYLNERSVLDYEMCPAARTLWEAEIRLDWSQASDPCRRVADRLLSSTSDLRTWEDWNGFCDTLTAELQDVPTTRELTALAQITSDLVVGPRLAADAVAARKDVLKANFNPNSDLNKANPDRTLARLVDKSDLLVYSTEFDLAPRSPDATVSSVGRILDARGRLLAERTLTGTVQGDSVLRLTTQAEFVAADLGELDLAGDETGFRAYGSAPYITPSRGLAGAMTFGHRLYAAQAPQGLSLQTMPEPHTVWTAGGGRPADYDGQVRLATVESAPAASMTFLANWDDGFDADYSAGGGSLLNAPDTLQAAATRSLWDETDAFGTLHTDGQYAEHQRQMLYEATSNMASTRGTVSVWFKPNYDVTKTANQWGLMEAHWHFRMVLWQGATNNTACLWLLNLYRSQMGLFWENTYAVGALGDDGREFWRRTPTREILPHRWYLATYFWDLSGPTQSDGAYVFVDRGLDADDQRSSSLYDATAAADPVSAPLADFAIPGATFCLGKRDNLLENTYGGLAYFPDCTFDEFAIYDFGAANAAAVQSARSLALNRFQEGRFYKESAYVALGHAANQAGEYFSAPIALGTGARILRAAWTQVVPRGLRAPAGARREDGDAGADGLVSVELVDAAAAFALFPRLTQPAGQAVGLDVPSPFRLHAVFQPNLSAPQDTAVLDPLALDDLTLFYRRGRGPRLLAWAEGETR